MNIKNINSGVYIMIGLLALAISFPVGIAKYTASKHRVSVRGLCEKEVKADRAIWPISFKVAGNDLATTNAEVRKQQEIVIDWLLEKGFTKDEISISAPSIDDNKNTSYNSENIRFNYIIKSTVTICTRNVDLVVSLQSQQFELLNKGIAISSDNYWSNTVVTYDFTALNDIKPEMIEKATTNAREAAEKFAKDSGSKVGRITNASQGQFSICSRDSETPYIKTVRVVTSVEYQLK